MPTKQRNRITLPADLRVANVAELKARLVELVNVAQDGKPLRLDASRVRQVDLAGIQLLLALKRECDHRGHELDWAGVSDAVGKAARAACLVGALQLEADE